MSDDEIIAVVRAHKEGKKIEVKPKARDSGYQYDWLHLIQPKWNFEKCDYRVAPEPRKPREWYAEIPINGGAGQIFTDSRQLTKGGELVLVREVLE